MIQHIVWWTLKPEGKNMLETIECDAQDLKKIKAAKSVVVSTKIAAGTTVPCQVVLMSTHDNLEQLEAYKKDPIHLKFAILIQSATDSRSCIDCEI